MRQLLAGVKKRWRLWLIPRTPDEETALWGYLLNVALLGFALVGLASTLLAFLPAWWRLPTGRVAVFNLFLPLIALVAFGLSHLGKVRLAATLLVAVLVAIPFATAQQLGAPVPNVTLWALAVLMAVLLLNVRLAVLTTLLVVGGYLAVGLLQKQGWLGQATLWPLSLGFVELGMSLYTVVFVLWLAGRVLREALQDALARVQDRAAALEEANRRYAELIEQRQETAAAQARAVVELEAVNTHYRELVARQADLLRTVRELSIPVLPLLPGVVLVPLVGVMTEERVSQMLDTILEDVARHRPRLVLLDITGLVVVDTHTVAQLLAVTRGITIMGGRPIVIGARPDISTTLVKLGADVSQLTAHSDLEASLAHISTYLRRNGGG
jgi:rsbT co-antagonist protein RsbR